MLPRKSLKIGIVSLNENESQATKFLDFSLTLEICDCVGRFPDFQKSISNILSSPGFSGQRRT